MLALTTVRNPRKWNATRSGYVTYDKELGKNSLVLGRNKVLRQNVQEAAVPGNDYRLGFRTKIRGTNKVDLRVILRFKFRAWNRSVSPCKKKFCNFYRRLVAKEIQNNEEWQEIVTDEFDFFRREVCFAFDSCASPILLPITTIFSIRFRPS